MAGKAHKGLGILNAVGQYYAPPPYMPPQRRSSGMATAGGALIIIAAVLGLITAIAIMWLGNFMSYDFLSDYGSEYDYAYDYDDVSSILYVCGAVILIFSIIALLGGVMAVTKKSWGLAILGGIFSMFCIGPIFLSSILGLIGLILVAASREDFDGQQPPAMYMPPPPPRTRFCMNCGRQTEESHKICPYCGKSF
ncbi:MAG: zinc ribbon domain-containing protein [Thermoplasmata archaeon]|nr:zinc ribbon domain-containing protein [Thermoplasmata archaeon]